MPEYCGVISVNPTVKARPEKIAIEEGKFDFSVLDKALQDAVYTNIDKIAEEDLLIHDVEILSIPVEGAVIIDVRHSSEEEINPLELSQIEIQKIPFYDLHSKFSELDTSKSYLLYCDRGVMSKLHAAYLVEQGYRNVKVYRPA